MKRRKLATAVALTACFGLVAPACGGDDDDADDGDDTETTEAPDSGDDGDDTETTEAPDSGDEMAEAVCPPNVVVQTDWWPELEHGGTYQLIGTGGTADAETFIYSGPIADAYKVGGIETVEVRAGGDAVSFTPVTSLMATDDDIMFGYVNMSDLIKDSASVEAVAVAKTLERDPQMIMWDPAQNDIQAPEDLAATGAQMLHFDGTAYIDYMISAGYLTEDQPNPSYGGAPTDWIAEGGSFLQQGFATNEVYKYENEIEWKDGAPAPVDFYTVGDLGFDNYAATMAVRADRVEELSPCLEVLVPMLSQAWVDFLADPTPMTDALIDINTTYNTYWTLSEGLNTRGLELLEELGMGANSPDGTYCSIDPARVEELHGILQPIYAEQGIEITADPAAMYDNSFCEGAPGR